MDASGRYYSKDQADRKRNDLPVRLLPIKAWTEFKIATMMQALLYQRDPALFSNMVKFSTEDIFKISDETDTSFLSYSYLFWKSLSIGTDTVYISLTCEFVFHAFFSPESFVLHFPVSHFPALHFWARLCHKFQSCKFQSHIFSIPSELTLLSNCSLLQVRS